MEQPDFMIKYKALIKGLDSDSIATIDKILFRIKESNQYKAGRYLDIFSAEEKKELLDLENNLNRQIIKVAADVYAWRDYFLPVNEFQPCVFYHHHGIKLLDREKIKNRDIVDVGGYIGDSALVLSRYTDKKVYTFEGMGANFAKLQKTIELNSLTNVVPVQLALGAEKQTGFMDLKGSGSVVTSGQGNGEIVQIMPLDDYVTANDVDVGLIKVDIEGFEQEFIKGAEQTIKLHKPALLLSIYHNMSDFFEIKPLLESWNLGYTFKVFRGTDGGIHRETMLVAEVVD